MRVPKRRRGETTTLSAGQMEQNDYRGERGWFGGDDDGPPI
jgi:hypothetical protein